MKISEENNDGARLRADDVFVFLLVRTTRDRGKNRRVNYIETCKERESKRRKGMYCGE